MNQNVWGKCGWVLIHSISINYPNNPSNSEKKNIIEFFTSLGKVLPCRYCRQHYKENLKELPIQANSKLELVYWTIDLHNKVNKSLGKSILSRDEALKKIIAVYKKNPTCPENYQLIYIGILLIIFSTICFINKK